MAARARAAYVNYIVVCGYLFGHAGHLWRFSGGNFFVPRVALQSSVGGKFVIFKRIT